MPLLCRHANTRATTSLGLVTGRNSESDDGLDVLHIGRSCWIYDACAVCQRLGLSSGHRHPRSTTIHDGTPSTYLWDGWSHPTHPPREGRGTRRPLLPMLFALGQHTALVAAQERLRGNELLFAYLDDVYAVPTRPCRGNLCDFGTSVASACRDSAAPRQNPGLQPWRCDTRWSRDG